MRISRGFLAGLRGLGACVEWDADGNCVADDGGSSSTPVDTSLNNLCTSSSCQQNGLTIINPTTGQPIDVTPVVVPPSTAVATLPVSPASSAAVLAQLLASAGTTLAKAFNPATGIMTIGGQQYSYNPATGQYSLLAGSALTSLTPILLIGGAILLFAEMGKR